MVVIAGWLAFRFPLDTLWNSQTYVITPHVSAEDAAMARVPDGVTVEATLTMLAPLAARDDTYWIGTYPNPAPDYVVFDDDQQRLEPAAGQRARVRASSVTRAGPTCGSSPTTALYVFRRVGRTGG